MGQSRLSRPDLAVHVGVVTLLAMILAIGLATLPHIGRGAVRSDEVTAGVAVSPVLSYQGRLTNPDTGAPQNGSFSFSLRLYNVESGGVALWTENKDIVVANGLFSTLLGDVTPIPSSIFNGQELWLGVKVGSDAEAAPRQRLLPVAYAMYSDNADRLDGYDSSSFFRGVKGVQLANQTLAAGASVTWSSWGYSPTQMVMWWAAPKTEGGRLSTSVETLLEGGTGAGKGLITYFITVRNTGSVTTNYDLIRYGFSQ